MFLRRLKLVSAAVVLLGITGGGLNMMALRPQAARESAPPAAAAPDDKPMSAEKRVDLYGDRLPEGAMMRLGTIQRRAIGTRIAVSADGKSILGFRGGRGVGTCWDIRIWDAATGRLCQTRQLPVQDRGFSPLAALSPQGRWLATYISHDPGLTLWDVRAGEKKHTFIVRDAGEFSRVSFSTNGRRLAAVCFVNKGQSVHVWDTDTGREVWQKSFETFRGILHLTFTPDGKQLLISFEASVAGTTCWDLATGQRRWQNKEFEPRSLVVTRRGRIIAQDLKMKALDLATGQPIPVERQPSVPWGNILSCSQDGRTLLISREKNVVVWDLLAGKALRTLHGVGEQAVFTPDGKDIVTNNGSLQLWDPATGQPLWADTFGQGHIAEVVTVVFSADGTRLASASTDGSVRLWDVRTGKPLRIWHGHEVWRDTLKSNWAYENVQAVDLTPDGRWLLSSGSGETIKLWDASREKVVRSLALPPRAEGESERFILRLRISPGGARATGLFVPRLYPHVPKGGRPYKLATWDLKTGALQTCHPIKMDAARPFAISPNGRTCLVSDLLVDSASGTKIVRLENEPGDILPNVFSRDGALVLNSFWVSLTRDGESRTANGVRIWESATGKKIAWLETAEMNWRMAAPTDHRLVATLGARWVEAENVLVWDVVAGRRLASWKMPGGHAGCIALSSDGRCLATGHADGTIFLWDVPLPASKPRRLEGKELEAVWAELAEDDAAKAWRAVWLMAEAPKDALPFLRERVKPYPTAPAEMRKLLADLDNDSFARREAAMKRLAELGWQAEPVLRATLKAKPSLEQKRRIEAVLAALPETPPPPSAEELQQLRALIVLERIGSPEARRLLEDVAKGPESARLTRQARAALASLR